MNNSHSLRSFVLLATLATGCYATPELENEPDGAGDARPQIGQTVQALTSLTSTQAELCVTASIDNNSGTTETVDLDYAGENFYSCSITGGFSSGQARCCTANRGSTNWEYATSFYVGIPSDGTDGFQFTAISYRLGSWPWTATVASWGVDGSIKGGGCSQGTCNNSWVDTDGNGRCHRGGLDLWSDTFSCQAGNGYMLD